LGTGTFNTSRWARAFGIKNPAPEVSERVIPVVSLGDFGDLTPSHVAPTGAFGGFQAAVVAEFASFQVLSRGAGGCWVDAIVESSLQLVRFTVGVGAIAGHVAATDRGPFSNEPLRTTVLAGTAPQAVLPANDAPLIVSGVNNFVPIWIPRGEILTVEMAAANLPWSWSVQLRDVPASESDE